MNKESVQNALLPWYILVSCGVAHVHVHSTNPTAANTSPAAVIPQLISVRRVTPPEFGELEVGKTVPVLLVTVPCVAVFPLLELLDSATCCDWLALRFSLGVVIFCQLACAFAVSLSGEKAIPYRLPPVVN